MVNVKVDYNKCHDSAGCRKCLDLCPVFTTYPLGPFYVDGNIPWRINPTIVSLCTGCRECQAACPAGAITVEF
jgi:ferredoxin